MSEKWVDRTQLFSSFTVPLTSAWLVTKGRTCTTVLVFEYTPYWEGSAVVDILARINLGVGLVALILLQGAMVGIYWSNRWWKSVAAVGCGFAGAFVILWVFLLGMLINMRVFR